MNDRREQLMRAAGRRTAARVPAAILPPTPERRNRARPNRIFVHFIDIVGEGFRSLEQGQRVSLVWDGRKADHGRHVATDVCVEG